MRPRRRVAVESAELQNSSPHLICPVGGLARGVRVRLALRTQRHQLGVESNGRSWHVASGATCSWVSPGLGFVEGLGGSRRLGPSPAGAEFSRALQLLAERAAAVKPEFAVTAENTGRRPSSR